MQPAARSLRTVILVALALDLVGKARPVAAQVTIVDEGTFSITVAGARVGREDFSIRRTALGTLVAQGNVLRGDIRATVVLNTDSAGTPERFRYDSNRGGRDDEQVSGERRVNLWSGLSTRPDGESGREFRLPDAVRVADDGVLHHFWFVLRFTRPGATALLQPRTMAMHSVVIEDAGADRVTIGLDELDAHKWNVRFPDGDVPFREVWLDARGRLLRVRIPAEELDATRDEPPPETPGL